MRRFLSSFFFLTVLIICLSATVFAADEAKVVVQGNFQATPSTGTTSYSVTLNDSGSEFSIPVSNIYLNTFTSGSAVMPNEGTLTFEVYPVSSSVSFSTSTVGYSISSTSSRNRAVVTITCDSNRTSSLCGFNINSSTFSSADNNARPITPSLSGFSYTSSEPVEPATPPSNTMQGMQNGVRYVQAAAENWEIYNQYIGWRYASMDGQFTNSSGVTVDSSVHSTSLNSDVLAGLGYNAYSWKINDSGLIEFNSGALASSWLDMVWKYLTYDYYWGTRLWSNDTSGSWYGDIKSSFVYLNYRVNQIFEVLANDEDLKIKDATDEERQWVQDYFENGTDIADSGKYDKLNDTSSAFKDLFSGAPESSLADGFASVNDNGYDFWSQAVSDEINGGGISTMSEDPDFQIVDFYSDNFVIIRGGCGWLTLCSLR